MRKLGSTSRAIAILAGAGIVAFAVSTAAVSSATTSGGVPAISVKYHFTSFTVTGGVSTGSASNPSTFSLSFTTSFSLPANSPGIVDNATGTLDAVSVQERVSYPIPAGRAAAQLVGSVQLPFSSQHLALVVAIKGSCFVSSPASGGYVFRGTVKCATATLTLGGKSYKASSLLRSVTGSFTPVASGAAGEWNGSLGATFANPGYTFPVATLGSGGGTSLIIGSNGGSVGTRSITFTGTTSKG